MAEPRVKIETWDESTVPIERWGKDHWTTLLHLETRTVDYRGVVAPERMRTAQRNWRLAGKVRGSNNIMPKDKYPTRLKPIQVERAKYDRVDLIGGHDDWECMHDMADLGLLTFEISRSYPLKVIVKMTDLGRKHCAEARKRREETGRSAA